MNDCIYSVGEATVFSPLDCNTCFKQALVPEEDKNMTAFVCYAGRYRYNRVPFGVHNATVNLQRALDSLLSRYRWQNLPKYIDDVSIISKRNAEHLEHFKEVLEVLEAGGVPLKFKNCDLFMKHVMYLGAENISR